MKFDEIKKKQEMTLLDMKSYLETFVEIISSEITG
jgi:hypothetical protein